MPRIALGIEYDGSAYHGWQRQAHAPTIQACVETALEAVACQPVSVTAAGRTDSGVHANAQVVHFDVPVERPDRAWLKGVNSHLPADIGVRWVARPGADFDARRTAIARRYRYLLMTTPLAPVLLRQRVGWSYQSLDIRRMHKAAQVLVGEHDFSSFRAAGCQAKHPYRQIHSLSVTHQADCVVIDIRANAFLHHMVRNIVGTLMRVGAGEQSPGWVADVLAACDRRLAGPTAGAEGLYFVGVEYPDCYDLPKPSVGPVFACIEGDE